MQRLNGLSAAKVPTGWYCQCHTSVSKNLVCGILGKISGRRNVSSTQIGSPASRDVWLRCARNGVDMFCHLSKTRERHRQTDGQACSRYSLHYRCMAKNLASFVADRQRTDSCEGRCIITGRPRGQGEQYCSWSACEKVLCSMRGRLASLKCTRTW